MQWADEIVVADSFSTDGTDHIAAKPGARVARIPFDGFGRLRNKVGAALERLCCGFASRCGP